ncbi:MAG TPA: amino acid racemase [bacterium]|nr:amino acid racemase [bacterium]
MTAGSGTPGAGAAAQRVIGVLGGMGPLATADFYMKLVRLTPARTDQEHPRVIIDGNAKIPDRTAAVAGRGPDPTPALVATAQNLERAGADLIVIPCNSAHAFLGAIREAVRIPVLDIMEEVAATVAALAPAPRSAGILATQATLEMQLYPRALTRRGIGVVQPTAAEEAVVMTAIHAVKGGDLDIGVRASVRAVAAALVARGAGVIVLGCTELPLVFGSGDATVPVVDATEILARAALREAGGEYGSPPQRCDQDGVKSTVPVRRS